MRWKSLLFIIGIQIYEFFTESGGIRKIIMVLDEMKKELKACGFFSCGVLFESMCGKWRAVHTWNLMTDVGIGGWAVWPG